MELGRPSSGKHWRLGQSGQSLIRRRVQEGGRKPSSGKDSRSIARKCKSIKEVLAPKAPFSEAISLEQFERYIVSRFDGKPSSDSNSTCGQSPNSNLTYKEIIATAHGNTHIQARTRFGVSNSSQVESTDSDSSTISNT
ncbi:hypothetical protein CR513_45422, partial [Mucuna pruriens]